MSKSPSNPKGTRDFLPSTLSKRNYILDIIKNNFKLFVISLTNFPMKSPESLNFFKSYNEYFN